MIQKAFTKNKQGKIEFTQTELDQLLNDVWQDGYSEGKNSDYTWTSPYYRWPSVITTPYYTTTTDLTGTTLNSSTAIDTSNNKITIKAKSEKETK